MTESTNRERELERVLLDLMIFAAPFASGRGMREARGNLMSSIKTAQTIIKAEPCQRDVRQSLVDLANAADEERQKLPTYRKDLDG